MPALVNAWRDRKADRSEVGIQTGVSPYLGPFGEDRLLDSVPSPLDFIAEPEEDVRKATAAALKLIKDHPPK